MKMIWQSKQNWKIRPCQSKSYKGQGHVKNTTQHIGLIISFGLSKISIKSINK